MYKSAIAAVTMTAAALLLAAMPALASGDPDSKTPEHGTCEKQMATLVKLRQPMLVVFTNGACADMELEMEEFGTDEFDIKEFGMEDETHEDMD
ncbi:MULTISPECIES: hypothetical protein [unclassified Nonomuraea]|uniref:hypothetical protein n=1 Tax=unclassified Nonomuraea TaxID=2593643 RepID=UPI0035BED02B